MPRNVRQPARNLTVAGKARYVRSMDRIDKAEPPLTPNEWARVPEHFAHDGFEDAITIAARGKRYGAVMALANAALPDDDPRKIDRDVIAIIDGCARICDEHSPFGMGGTEVRKIARALESLLPPRVR